jgi:hypothetical protein
MTKSGCRFSRNARAAALLSVANSALAPTDSLSHGCIVASLDRKYLGPSEVTSGLGRRLVGRDIFDEETRWKLLAIAADVKLLSLYMGFEWRFLLLFALLLLTI